MKKATLVPVVDDNGDVVLLDIYIEGKWYGSRSTEKQCQEYINYFSDKINETIVVNRT